MVVQPFTRSKPAGPNVFCSRNTREAVRSRDCQGWRVIAHIWTRRESFDYGQYAQRAGQGRLRHRGKISMFTDHTVADTVLRGIILSVTGVIWVLIVVRFTGLRSFSKLTTVDFVTTVAIGSLMAGGSQSTEWLAFCQSIIAIAALLVLQAVFAWGRIQSEQLRKIAQNQPVLLMRNGQFLPRPMRENHVTENELYSKLRAANIADPASVQAVVLETTGDISILHGHEIRGSLLTGVSRPDR